MSTQALGEPPIRYACPGCHLVHQLVSSYLLMHHCSQTRMVCMTKRSVLCSRWAATASFSLLQALLALLCSVSLQATSS